VAPDPLLAEAQHQGCRDGIVDAPQVPQDGGGAQAKECGKEPGQLPSRSFFELAGFAGVEDEQRTLFELHVGVDELSHGDGSIMKDEVGLQGVVGDVPGQVRSLEESRERARRAESRWLCAVQPHHSQSLRKAKLSWLTGFVGPSGYEGQLCLGRTGNSAKGTGLFSFLEIVVGRESFQLGLLMVLQAKPAENGQHHCNPSAGWCGFRDVGSVSAAIHRSIILTCSNST
jgi:hypothetical protein